MNFFLGISLTLGFFFLLPSTSLAQEDTTYYISYKKMLTTRLYTSRKYTSLLISGINESTRIRLEPNSTLNLGIGATYNDFTLNLAYGFGFMNPNRDQVETQYLDLQAHAYPKNWVIDLFAQFYRGFYVNSYSGPLPNIPSELAFPDMKVRKFGANVQYLLNGDKLSLKAAFLQSAWQKKSAGSFVAGMEFYFGMAEDTQNILAELIPDPLEFKRLDFFEFGPNIGYVHTIVIARHFFITGMVSGNIGLGNSSITTDLGKEGNWGFNTNYFLRGFAGYNGPIWSINANYVHNNVRIEEAKNYVTDFQTGNYRINFVYRFDVGPKLRPVLDYVDINKYLPKSKNGKKKKEEQ
ncbi:DUF4421 domain-containing protein [Aquiflexum gelatinilyticum]|uniref:DUF4421 domain-containing protein n=1 Tax=Aquiflexum gelatinilyticum TaxID=2961943 RepID=A0A9X2PA91_9BACT|nr:DUF4421 domain-containing protein [Aquiflexum gelatinilyticum]MCR9015914.1 DUF4421 domain-containing protein [Aquiflexum gelatinilyticum]MCS4435975.1 DUF4421 domain-containing protein [Aquiflexum gelatinilyticum]